MPDESGKLDPVTFYVNGQTIAIDCGQSNTYGNS